MTRYGDEAYVVMSDKLHSGQPLDHDEAAMFLRTHHRYSHDQADAAVAEAEREGMHAVKGAIGSALLLVHVNDGYLVDR